MEGVGLCGRTPQKQIGPDEGPIILAMQRNPRAMTGAPYAAVAAPVRADLPDNRADDFDGEAGAVRDGAYSSLRALALGAMNCWMR
jgi:hypothetical protein